MKHTSTHLALLLSCLGFTGAFAQPGSLDPTFGDAGIKILQPSNSHDVGHEVIALDDTTLLVCGVAFQAGTPVAFIAHLLQDGTPDPNYGTNAGYTFFDAGEEAYAYDMERAADGSVYLAGTAYPTFAQQVVLLIHVLEDGTPDLGFGTGGMVTTPVGAGDSEAQDMAIQADGKLVLAGRAGFGSTSNSLLLRYEPDGTLDGTFSGDGILEITSYPNAEDQLRAVDILGDGSSISTGHADLIGDQKTILVKVDASGVPVSAFGGDGVLVPALNATADQGWGILGDGGTFYVTGVHMDVMSDYDVYTAKFNSDGTLAAGFGTGGFTVTNTNVNEYGFDIEKQADGKVVVCGTSGLFGFGAPRDFLMIRYGTDGIADAGFGTNGVVITSIQNDFDDAYGCTIQPDGKIVSAGFTSGLSLGTDNDLALIRYIGDLSTGIPAPSVAMEEMTITPNVVSDVAWITLPSNRPALVRIVDMKGAEVMPAITTSSRSLPLALHALPTGSYRVVTTQGGRLHVVPFAVVR